MIYVNIPEENVRRLPFYLAAEEFLARRIRPSDEDLFFMWQVNPTVIFGRNQVVEQEINLDYCRANGIEFYRRKSGGGCVFANLDNVMFSYITADASGVAATFSLYTSMVAGMLRDLGLNATATDRNDVLIDGLKVSGNAFYHLPTASIAHGTMLYRTDLEAMSRALTPSRQKLSAKGVSSVRSRVTSLSEHIDLDLDQFKQFARRHLTDKELTLSPTDIAEILEIEKEYYNPKWIYRHSNPLPHRQPRRIEGVGEFSVTVRQDSLGCISDLQLAGDFFELNDVDKEICAPLKGVRLNRDSLARALAAIPVKRIISGLDRRQLIDLIIENPN